MEVDLRGTVGWTEDRKALKKPETRAHIHEFTEGRLYPMSTANSSFPIILSF